LPPLKICRTLPDTVTPPGILERLARYRSPEKPGAINLMAREGRAEDLAACRALHQTVGLPYGETCWRVLPEMWQALLANGIMHLFLVEDRARPVGSRIISFGVTAFVTDEFCSAAELTLPPNLGHNSAG
jgi:hypothetical protein